MGSIISARCSSWSPINISSILTSRKAPENKIGVFFYVNYIVVNVNWHLYIINLCTHHSEQTKD